VYGAVERIGGRRIFSCSYSSLSDCNKRFPPEKRRAQWLALQEALGLSLPELEQPPNEEYPCVPRECDSILKLSHWIAEHYPDRVEWAPLSLDRAGKMADKTWTEEEVWRILQDCIVDALGVKREAVTPEARMIEDLGMG
jgi:hypothetical protein